MIKYKDHQCIIELGAGDIEISGGWKIKESGDKIGVVTFKNLDYPIPVGTILYTQIRKISLDNPDILAYMTFSDIKSIDVLIDILEKVKLYMEEEVKDTIVDENA